MRMPRPVVNVLPERVPRLSPPNIVRDRPGNGCLSRSRLNEIKQSLGANAQDFTGRHEVTGFVVTVPQQLPALREFRFREPGFAVMHDPRPRLTRDKPTRREKLRV